MGVLRGKEICVCQTFACTSGESCGVKCSNACEAAALAVHVSISLCEGSVPLRRDGMFTHWPPHSPHDAHPSRAWGRCLLAGGESFPAPPAHLHSLHAELVGVRAVGHKGAVPLAPCSSLGFPGSGPGRAMPGRAM